MFRLLVHWSPFLYGSLVLLCDVIDARSLLPSHAKDRNLHSRTLHQNKITMSFCVSRALCSDMHSRTCLMVHCRDESLQFQHLLYPYVSTILHFYSIHSFASYTYCYLLHNMNLSMCRFTLVFVAQPQNARNCDERRCEPLGNSFSSPNLLEEKDSPQSAHQNGRLAETVANALP